MTDKSLVLVFRIELEFGNVDFCRGEGTEPQYPEKTLLEQRRKATTNFHNCHMLVPRSSTVTKDQKLEHITVLTGNNHFTHCYVKGPFCYVNYVFFSVIGTQMSRNSHIFYFCKLFKTTWWGFNQLKKVTSWGRDKKGPIHVRISH